MDRPPLRVPRLRRGPVVLRAFTAADTSLVVEASADACITATTTVPKSPSEHEVHAFLERQHERARSGQGWSLAIADAATDQGVGQIGLWPHEGGRASVGCWVVPSARRRNIATAALTCSSAWGLRQDGIVRLELCVEPWNAARRAPAREDQSPGRRRHPMTVDEPRTRPAPELVLMPSSAG